MCACLPIGHDAVLSWGVELFVVACIQHGEQFVSLAFLHYTPCPCATAEKTNHYPVSNGFVYSLGSFQTILFIVAYVIHVLFSTMYRSSIF